MTSVPGVKVYGASVDALHGVLVSEADWACNLLASKSAPSPPIGGRSLSHSQLDLVFDNSLSLLALLLHLILCGQR